MSSVVSPSVVSSSASSTEAVEPALEQDGTAGITIDVLTGIVAGLALVLALLILAASFQADPVAAHGVAAHGAVPAKGPAVTQAIDAGKVTAR